MNVPYFKLLHFGDICYAAIGNKQTVEWDKLARGVMGTHVEMKHQTTVAGKSYIW